MVNLKKISAAFLAAAMLFSFSACSKGGDASADNAAETETAAEPTASARVSVDGTKFMVDGKELWINGTNTPWEKWNDFDGNMDEEFWDKTFAQLAADNVNCTRIWINCSGENIIQLKTTGEVKSITEGHWTDLDKLFAIAEKYKVYVMPTLLSFDHFKGTAKFSAGDKWRNLIMSKEMTDAFAENYVKTFCERYGNCEYIFGIDIMNEPDWVKENDECGKVGFEYLSYFFGKCASVIHENSDILVTVGMGMIKYNSDKYDGNYVSDEFLKQLTGLDDAYLDFYSPHYYAWMLSSMPHPFDKSPVDFGLDGTKPAIIGETPNDDEAQMNLTSAQKYEYCFNNGWNGVMTWMDPQKSGESYEYYKYDLTASATNHMNELIPEKVHPLG